MRPNVGVLRSAIAAMLTETGMIRRATGNMVQNEETGYEEPEYVTVFSGPVLVRPEGNIQYVAVAGTDLPVRSFDVTFPAESDVVLGDVLTLTACPNDPALVGAPIRITDVRHDSWQVALSCTGKLDGSA